MIEVLAPAKANQNCFHPCPVQLRPQRVGPNRVFWLKVEGWWRRCYTWIKLTVGITVNLSLASASGSGSRARGMVQDLRCAITVKLSITAQFGLTHAGCVPSLSRFACSTGRHRPRIPTFGTDSPEPKHNAAVAICGRGARGCRRRSSFAVA